MKSLALAFGLLTLTTPAFATPISFTGAELLNVTGISFPTGARTVVGDSLRIGATDLNSTIVALPLDQFDVDVSDFEVQISFTRLLRGDGSVDHDPLVYLSDGRNLFGGVFGDGANNEFF